MTYASGANIEALDYNFFVGGPTANVVGQINTVLSTGKGNAGYGQTTVANVGVNTTVTDAQWTTLINAINTVRKHQSGAGFSNIKPYFAGTRINDNADVNRNLSEAHLYRLSAAATSTVIGSNFASTFTLATTVNAQTFNLTRTATFANANAARYFWNAGGQLKLVFVSFTNNDGTQRSADLGNLAVNNVGTKAVKAVDCVARTGTGGRLSIDLTTDAGYYARTASNVALTQVYSTQDRYTDDTILIYGKTNGTQGSNLDNGTVFSFGVDLTSGTRAAAFNQSIDITLNNRVDVVYPAGGFLANTWGAVTIA
jgi:hypothetical protein